MAATIKEEEQISDTWLQANFENCVVKTEFHVKTEKDLKHSVKAETEEDLKINQHDKNEDTSKKDNSPDITKGQDISNPRLPAEEWKKLLSTIRFSEQAGSFCKYKCFVCGTIFPSHSTIRDHLYKNPSHRSMKSISAHLVSAVGHECRLCRKKLLNEKLYLGYHLRGCHKISLAAYTRKFNCKKVPILSEDARAFKTIVEDAPLSESLGSFCEFKCIVCKKTLGASDGLKRHLRRSKHGKFLAKNIVRAVSYKCVLCNEKMLCDALIVAKHVNLKHKMLLKDYKDKFCVTASDTQLKKAPFSKDIANLCPFKCLHCEEGLFNSSRRLQIHLKNNHDVQQRLLSNAIRNYIVDMVCHKCQICSKVILCDNLIMSNHLYGNHKALLTEYRKAYNCLMNLTRLKIPNEILEMAPLSEAVTSLCKMKCLSCHKIYNSVSGLRSHLTAHPTHGKIRLLLNHITKMVVHKCKLCGQLILCDSSCFTYHFKKSHGISVAAYCKTD
jgi:hypothetical protein